MTAAWQRFGPEGHWTKDLAEADRLALLGESVKVSPGVPASAGTSAGTKACRTCGTVKSLEEFGTKASAKDGRQSHCKPCRRVGGPSAEPTEVLDESNSRICRSCYVQVSRRDFPADTTRPSGLARICTPCVERKGL